MKLLIIGATGLLGNFLYKSLKSSFFITGSSRKNKKYLQLDLNNTKNTTDFFKKNKFDVIINTSGLVDVDKCNNNLNLAKKFNFQTVRNLVNSLKKLKINPHIIHFSTDQVYNNQKTHLNTETKINLSNNYSKSKYLGELFLKKYKKKTIIRTNFFGEIAGSKKKSFSNFIITKLLNKQKLRIPNNIYFSPIHISFIPIALKKIINNKIFGTYNLGSSDSNSKFNFVKEIAEIKKLKKKLIIPFNSNYKINKRPYGTGMNINKIENDLRIKLPTLKKSIQMLLK